MLRDNSRAVLIITRVEQTGFLIRAPASVFIPPQIVHHLPICHGHQLPDRPITTEHLAGETELSGKTWTYLLMKTADGSVVILTQFCSLFEYPGGRKHISDALVGHHGWVEAMRIDPGADCGIAVIPCQAVAGCLDRNHGLFLAVTFRVEGHPGNQFWIQLAIVAFDIDPTINHFMRQVGLEHAGERLEVGYLYVNLPLPGQLQSVKRPACTGVSSQFCCPDQVGKGFTAYSVEADESAPLAVPYGKELSIVLQFRYLCCKKSAVRNGYRHDLASWAWDSRLNAASSSARP